MPQTSLNAPGALGVVRAALLSVAVPVVVAWLLMHVVHSRVYPEEPRAPAAEANSYGPVRMRLVLPGTSAGIPEPLVACGITGNASVAYIRLLPGNRAKVGIDFWGMRADQSPDFPIPSSDAVIDVVCYLPAFFPPETDPYWGGLSQEFRRMRRNEYYIEVNGVVRLKAPATYIQAEHSPIYYGENPLGGSLVSDRFTGVVLSASQKY
jgi:hypothetical protein